MKPLTKAFAAALLASTSSATFASDDDARIRTLESQIQELSKQIQALKNEEHDRQLAAAQERQAAAEQQAEIKKQQASTAKPTIGNGRLQVSSADGAFSVAVRAQVQFDAGYYMQDAGAASLPAAHGPDLSSGANMRRVQLGLQGKVFGDWSYFFLYDFAGPSTETPGHILNAFLQYDGLAPWAIRAGVYAPPVNIEDSTGSADLLFLERNAPSDLARNIAGSEGRDAISVLYTGDRLFGAVSLSGNKISDGAKALAAAGATAVPNYDEQIATLGRLSYLPVSTDGAHWIVGVNGTYVAKLPDLAPGGSKTLATAPGAAANSAITLNDAPEITVDSNGVNLVTTGALAADHVTQWGVETAANVRNFYTQAGYYSYAVHRTPQAYTVFSNAGVSAPAVVQPGNNTFSGWYVEGSWILTGESKSYNKACGSFAAPVPAKPFSLKDGGWGAFELAARLSDLNLNSHARDSASVITGWTSAGRSYTFYNTVRGGDQKVVTLAANWYLNSVVRLALDYQWIDVNRLQAASVATTSGTPSLPVVDGGQTLQTLAFRMQMAI